MGNRKGSVVDASTVTGEVSGLVIISVVSGSVVGSMVVGGGAVVVTTVEMSVGVVVSIMIVVSVGAG